MITALESIRDYASKHRVRTWLYVGLAWYASMAILGGVLTSNSQSGCERGDALRDAALRIAEALAEENRNDPFQNQAEYDADQDALADYEDIASDLIAANAPVAESPGSVRIDCQKAYPNPLLPGFLQ